MILKMTSPQDNGSPCPHNSTVSVVFDCTDVTWNPLVGAGRLPRAQDGVVIVSRPLYADGLGIVNANTSQSFGVAVTYGNPTAGNITPPANEMLAYAIFL